MEIEAVLSALRLPAGTAARLSPHWADSESTYPPDGPAWLADAETVSRREFAGLDQRYDAPLRAAAAAIRQRPAASHLAWHLVNLAFVHLDYDLTQACHWPDLSSVLGDQAPLFYLVVAFQAIPGLRRAHLERGIPEAVSRATCTHYHEATALYALTHAGRLGVRPGMLAWLRHHIRGELCCLGRLEYMLRPFQGQVRAFRHRDRGLVVALAESGAAFTANGLGAVPAPFAPPEEIWTAALETAGNTLRGHPIAPDGRALRTPVTLRLDEWAPALVPGDVIIETHIPPGGGMTPERCAASMREALGFFPRHFPEARFAGFACSSWVLNPELAQFYSPASNMVLWQRELHLFPVPSNGRAGLQFIFGESTVDPATAPRDTALRRALLDRLAAGRPLRAGGMFCLSAEMAEYGTQPYQRRWPEVCACLGL